MRTNLTNELSSLQRVGDNAARFVGVCVSVDDGDVLYTVLSGRLRKSIDFRCNYEFLLDYERDDDERAAELASLPPLPHWRQQTEREEPVFVSSFIGAVPPPLMYNTWLDVSDNFLCEWVGDH